MSEEINPLPVHGGNGATDLERWITGIKTPALVINPQGRVLFANPCAVQQFNISTRRPGDPAGGSHTEKRNSLPTSQS